VSLLRTLRGVVGTALTWAGGWAVLGAVLHGVAVGLGWYGMFGVTLVADVVGHAAMGLLGGAGFSIGLLFTERRGTLSELSVIRSAAWGAVSALGGSVVVLASLGGFGMLPSLMPVIVAAGAFGALSGGGMSAVALRSPDFSNEGRLLER
jgi:hypothetical protein